MSIVVPSGRTLSLNVLAGSVWAGAETVSSDDVLVAGDEWSAGPGRTVLTALRPGAAVAWRVVDRR